MTLVTVWVYILRCADGSYYVGKYQGQDLAYRIEEYNSGHYPDAYTAKRRPVELVWADWFPRYDDAVLFERRLKGWSRAKKEALIRGDEAALKLYARRGFKPSSLHAEECALRDAGLRPAPQGEALQFLHPEEPREARRLEGRDAPPGGAPQDEGGARGEEGRK